MTQPRVPIRLAEKASTDRAVLDALLDASYVGHFGLVADDGTPVVVPTAVVRDGDAGVPRFAASAATRALGLLTAQLEHATVDEIIENGLQAYLNGVQRDLARVTDHVTRVYLRDEPHEGRLLGVARAIRLMAEQHQVRDQ